jgi:hypothetical protein
LKFFRGVTVQVDAPDVVGAFAEKVTLKVWEEPSTTVLLPDVNLYGAVPLRVQGLGAE